MPLTISNTGVRNELIRATGVALAISPSGTTQAIVTASAYGVPYFSSVQIVETDSTGLTISVDSGNWGLGASGGSPVFGGPNTGLSNVSLTLTRGTVIYGKFTEIEITAGTGKLAAYLPS